MTSLCALKFVPRSVLLRTISATFSLSLLASCSSLPPIPFFDEEPAAAAPATGQPTKWGDRVEGVVITDPAYVIGPEDALDIAVWKDETLKAAALVRPDHYTYGSAADAAGLAALLAHWNAR